MGFLDDQLVHFFDSCLAKRRISPRDIGMVANLSLDSGVPPDEQPGHHVLGQICFHLSRIEGLDQHQHHQGYI
jgi:hypothetical protein